MGLEEVSLVSPRKSSLWGGIQGLGITIITLAVSAQLQGHPASSVSAAAGGVYQKRRTRLFIRTTVHTHTHCSSAKVDYKDRNLTLQTTHTATMHCHSNTTSQRGKSVMLLNISTPVSQSQSQSQTTSHILPAIRVINSALCSVMLPLSCPGPSCLFICSPCSLNVLGCRCC